MPKQDAQNGNPREDEFNGAAMIRPTLAMAAIASLGASLLLPPVATARQDCHPAYRDVCVPKRQVNKKIAVDKGFKTKALCILLGSWTGENPVIIEWNGRYATRKIEAKGHSSAVMIRVKQGREPGYLKVYSPGSRRTVAHEWSTCSTAMASNIENMNWQ